MRALQEGTSSQEVGGDPNFCSGQVLRFCAFQMPLTDTRDTFGRAILAMVATIAILR